MNQGAAVLTGLGFTGYDSSGNSRWNDASNVDILGIEFPTGFKGLIDSWNIKTNIWLRECVYKRVTPKGKKPGFWSSMATFGTSAFWVSEFRSLFSFASDFLILLVCTVARSPDRLLPDFPCGRIHHQCSPSCTSQFPSLLPPTFFPFFHETLV